MADHSSRSEPPARAAGRVLEVSRLLSAVPELSPQKKKEYSLWIVAYLRSLDRQGQADPHPRHIRPFLRALAERGEMSEAQRRQAAEALIFFHECILGDRVREVHGKLDVLSIKERTAVLRQLRGPERLLARLVFRTELDLLEAVRLRVGDLDLDRGRIVVTDPNGASKRLVDVTTELVEDLTQHLERLKSRHEREVAEGKGFVDLPPSVEEYFPGAPQAWVWQYVFPSADDRVDLRSGQERRYPMRPDRLIASLDRRTAPMTRALQSEDVDPPSESPDSSEDDDGSFPR